jgi:hypothetical protein
MKSRIVGSLSELQRRTHSKAQDLMQDLAKDTALSIIKSKPNHNKSSSIFITMLLLIFRLSINLRTKLSVLLHDLKLPMTFEVTLDTENLLIEAVDAHSTSWGRRNLTKLLIDFTMEKRMMINPGIFRVRDSGHRAFGS